jgi:hypothetical protein
MFLSGASGMRPRRKMLLRNSAGAAKSSGTANPAGGTTPPSRRDQGHDQLACHWTLTTQACNNFGVVLKNETAIRLALTGLIQSAA